MRTATGLILTVVFGITLALGVRADEEKVPLDKLPKAVLLAVRHRFPKAELKSAEKEEVEGKTVYEVAINNKGQKIDVSLTPEGAITEIEQQIAAKELPKTVSEALHAKYPKATLKVVEEVILVKAGKEQLEAYEVHLVTADDRRLEVSVSPAGKLSAEEDVSKEKD